jgi:uncharacterized membrane protein YdbT with pleckstrin-like domain
MTTFKSAYDLAQKRIQVVNEKAQEIENLLGGTEEDVTTALALEPALDEAQAEAQKAIDLYNKLTKAGDLADSAAGLFVPVSEAAAETSAAKTTMTREAFDGMNYSDKIAFLDRGGKVTEEKE